MHQLSPRQQLLARSYAEHLAMDTYLQFYPSTWTFDEVVSAVIDETGDVEVWPQFEDMSPSDIAKQITDLVPDFESQHRSLLEANNLDMVAIRDNKMFGVPIRVSPGADNKMVAFFVNESQNKAWILSDAVGNTHDEALKELKEAVLKLLLS